MGEDIFQAAYAEEEVEVSLKHLLFILALACLACYQSATPPIQNVPTATMERRREAMVNTPAVTSVGLCGDVNVRESAAPTGKVIRWLRAGATVIVLERVEGWVRMGAGEWITDTVLCDHIQMNAGQEAEEYGAKGNLRNRPRRK